MYEVYEDMPFEGTFTIAVFNDLEEARKVARKVTNGTYLEYKLDKGSYVGLKQEYTF